MATLVGRAAHLHRGGGTVSPLSSTSERLRQLKAARMGNAIGFLPWNMKTPEPKAGPLDFNTFPPQRELYDEGVHDKEAVVQKGTQVGVSAWAIRWSLYHADTRGRTGLYVFPTKGDMWDYSTLRVGPLLDGSDYLRSRRAPDDPDNKGMKGVGLGMVVFRGSESKRGLDSVDADHIVFDEYDTLQHANIPDAEKRVSSPLSPGLIRRVGVPSIPDWGIGKLYDLSDKRQWFVKCSRCGTAQVVDFWKNIDMTTGERLCADVDCRGQLDLTQGEWVAEFPDRDVRGYHLTRLSLPTVDMKPIIVESRKKGPHEVQVFMNKTLGLPFVPEEGRLSKKAIQAATRQYMTATTIDEIQPQSAELVTMGVDVATVRNLNVRVSAHFEEGGVAKKKALFIGEVVDFEDLDTLMALFSVHCAAIDHEPDGRLSRAFAERHPGRVWVCALKGGEKSAENPVIPNDDMMFVSVDRTVGIDAAFEAIRGQRNLLPINPPSDGEEETWVQHMQSNVRMLEEDDFGKKVIKYRKTTPDDYAMAELFDVVAEEMWWRMKGIEEAEQEEFGSLEDELGYERSALADYGHGDYNAGPGDRQDDFHVPSG